MTNQPPSDAPKAPLNAIWSDAHHHVRPVGPKDKHVMRFIVAAHDKASPLKRRHVATVEDGVDYCDRMTRLMAGKKPVESRGRKSAVPVSTQIVMEPKRDGRRRTTPKAVPWSTERFECYAANSVAQVWKCVVKRGNRRNGRRSEVPMPHEEGQFMVTTIKDKEDIEITMVRDPVRDKMGIPAVYGYGEAIEVMQNEYEDADGEFQFYSRNRADIYATINCVIRHDAHFPGCSNTSPFYIWLKAYSKPYYVNTTHALLGVGGTSESILIANGATEEFLQFVRESRRKQRAMSQVSSFSSLAQACKSIDLAIELADYIDEHYFKGQDMGEEGSRAPESGGLYFGVDE